MEDFNLYDIMEKFGTKEEIKSLLSLDDKDYNKIDDFVFSFRRTLEFLCIFISIEKEEKQQTRLEVENGKN